MDNLGLDFIDEVDKSIDLIQKSPKQWPIVEENFRKYILQKFPFIIYYIDDLEEIIILAIVHQSRKPGYWKNR
jgi:plasmid stabilization system protein ParE